MIKPQTNKKIKNFYQIWNTFEIKKIYYFNILSKYICIYSGIGQVGIWRNIFKIYITLKIGKWKILYNLEYKNCDYIRKSSNSKDKQSIFVYY